MTTTNTALVGHTHAKMTVRLDDAEVPVMRLDAWSDDGDTSTDYCQTTLHLYRFDQEELRELVRTMEYAADMISEVLIAPLTPEEVREAHLSAQGDAIHDAHVENQLTDDDTQIWPEIGI